MEYLAGYYSHAGIKKKINQDSLCIKKAITSNGEICMAVICDGMGGLSKGELASAAAIAAFSNWFEEELPQIAEGADSSRIADMWVRLVRQMNEKIYRYGSLNHVQLGTTLTGILLLEDGTYLIVHVGDSRAYMLEQNQIVQLTEDQSLTAREVKRGNITPDQAVLDARRNILLQCIGAASVTEPELHTGRLQAGQKVLLCSDGFCHKVSNQELVHYVNQKELASVCEINQRMEQMVMLNEARGETDNISAILINTI